MMTINGVIPRWVAPFCLNQEVNDSKRTRHRGIFQLL